MSTVTETRTASPPVSRPIEARQMFTLDNITWDQYVTIADALPDKPGLRITYDGERLELMTTSQRHERVKRLIGRMIEMTTLELMMDLQSGGNVTMRREDIERGLEPDECYWIANARAMIGVNDLDMTIHPPPDLALEIDVKSRSIARQPIYAKLGVLEIWRYDGTRIQPLRLEENGEYTPIKHSLSLPFLRVADLLPFLDRSDTETESDTIRTFVSWLHEQNFPSASM